MDQIDRRNSPRQRKEVNIQVLLISDFSNDHKKSCDLIPVKMLNQSENGLCIEINRYLMSGSTVRIKIAFQQDSCIEEAYYLRDGLVRWCEMVVAQGARFGAGIRILRKVVQAPVLTSRFVCQPANN